MAFLQANQLAVHVIQVNGENLPAVLVEIEAALAERMAETFTQVCLDHPNAVQLIAQQFGVEVLALNDVLVRNTLLVNGIAVVRHKHFLLALEGPFVAIRRAVVGVNHVGGGQTISVWLQRIVCQHRQTTHTAIATTETPGLANGQNLIDCFLHHQRRTGYA